MRFFSYLHVQKDDETKPGVPLKYKIAITIIKNPFQTMNQKVKFLSSNQMFLMCAIQATLITH